MDTGPIADRAAFDRLVIEHLPAAQRFAIRLTGDPDAAEEVVQVALARAAGNWRGFRGQCRFTTWLFQIVVNAFRDRLRATRSREDGTDVSGLPDDLAATGPGPDHAAQVAELGEIVARIVSRLPPRQREVLVLSAYEGHDTAAIAAMLGITQQNARTTLHLARERVRAQLSPYLSERNERESRQRTT